MLSKGSLDAALVIACCIAVRPAPARLPVSVLFLTWLAVQAALLHWTLPCHDTVFSHPFVKAPLCFEVSGFRIRGVHIVAYKCHITYLPILVMSSQSSLFNNR